MMLTRVSEAFRFYVSLYPIAAIVTAVVGALSYLLGDLLSRREPLEPSLLFLASRQVAILLFAATITAAVVATLTMRFLKSSASEQEIDSPRARFQLLHIRFVSYLAAPLIAWVLYLVLTAIQRATSIANFWSALGLWIGTTSAIIACGALGLAVAHVVRNYAAPVVAAGLIYGLILVIGGRGDESWWGWLVPYVDDAMRGTLKVSWFLGYTFWYIGIAFLIIRVTALSQDPFSRRMTTLRGAPSAFLAIVVPLALPSIGTLLLILNGNAASTGTG